jgi:hypothetical protein
MGMALASDSYIGKGAYSIADAARIVHAPYTTVRGWLHGVGPRRFPHDIQIVSFVELMEIHFIKMFMDEGVAPRTIHAAARTAAKLFETDYPFAVKRFDTDGRDIFATLAKQDGGAEMIEDLRKSQFVFKTIMRCCAHFKWMSSRFARSFRSKLQMPRYHYRHFPCARCHCSQQTPLRPREAVFVWAAGRSQRSEGGTSNQQLATRTSR